MHPILFRLFGFEVSTFGVMLAIAFLAGTWITAVRMGEVGLDPDGATTMLVYAMVGGIGGSKLYFAVDTWLRGELSFSQALFSRAGITFYGGLVGAIVLVVIGTRIHRIPTNRFFNCVCLAGALGQAIGRIGCLLVGDDYGRPTNLPWGIAFPKGAPPIDVPVHPTQIYESAWLFAVTGLLWARRRRSPLLWGEYLVLAGLGRFLNEFVRTNPRVAFGLSEAQLIALGGMVVGATAWWIARRRAALASA
jgi:phosphatidylglycerol:prolipoprotein diacylglycerol transferase